MDDHPGGNELFHVMLALLAASWRQVGFLYSRLAPHERDLITPEQHARIVLLMRHARAVDGVTMEQRASQLAQRAALYGESAVEHVELAAELAAADMERVAGGLASGFIVGYGACLDDQRNTPRLVRGPLGNGRKGRRKK